MTKFISPCCQRPGLADPERTPRKLVFDATESATPTRHRPASFVLAVDFPGGFSGIPLYLSPTQHLLCRGRPAARARRGRGDDPPSRHADSMAAKRRCSVPHRMVVD